MTDISQVKCLSQAQAPKSAARAIPLVTKIKPTFVPTNTKYTLDCITTSPTSLPPTTITPSLPPPELTITVLGSGPIAGAVVLLTYGNGLTQQGVTDSSGNVSFSLINTGLIRINIGPPASDIFHGSIVAVASIFGNAFLSVVLPRIATIYNVLMFTWTVTDSVPSTSVTKTPGGVVQVTDSVPSTSVTSSIS